MNIKNLVLGGGGIGGLNMYGAIKNMIENKYLDINKIEKIYSVSVGALMAVIFALKLDNQIVDDYLIKRPWHKFINIKPNNILNIWKDKGIFDKSLINIIIKPLLLSKNLDENITLKDFYKVTNIDINMFTVNINSDLPEKIKISHTNYPDLELCTALAMTTCVPIAFMPVYFDNKCFIDGGIVDNFPLGEFLNDSKENINIEKETLCFKIKSNNDKKLITKDINLLEYLFTLVFTLRKFSLNKSESYEIKNIIECNIKNNFLEKWYEALYDEELRKNLIIDGKLDSDQFITEFKNSSNVSTDGLAS